MLDLLLTVGLLALLTVTRTAWAACCVVLGGYYLTAPETTKLLHLAREYEIEEKLSPRSVRLEIRTETDHG